MNPQKADRGFGRRKHVRAVIRVSVQTARVVITISSGDETLVVIIPKAG